MSGANKFIAFMLIIFFISSTFVTTANPVSSSEFVENSWTAKASMSQARYGLGVVAVDGKIYAIGGSTEYGFDNNYFVGTNEMYDPKLDTWITLEVMPTRRAHFAIAVYEGKIYCIGGATPDERGDWIACDVNEVYNIDTNSWSTKASSPVSGVRCANVVKGKIFVIQEDGDMYMYDPITDTWIQKASTPARLLANSYVSHCVSAVVDNKIIVIGDFGVNQLSDLSIDQSGSFLVMVSRAQKIMIYDPKTDTWSERADPPRGVICDAVGVTMGRYAPQKIYVLSSDSNYVYDYAHDTWLAVKTMPTSRSDFGVAVVDDILYVIGGGIVSVNEQYVPIGYQSTLPIGAKFSVNNIVTVAVVIILIIGVIGGLALFFKRNTKT